MAKQRKQPTLSAAQEKRAIVGTALGAMLGRGLLGMPGQVRLAAREQQPRPFVPPKGKGRKRG
jgi:hypothetical protein